MGHSEILRRSVLVTPGSSLKMIGKAAGAGALVIDLEDAVAPGQKQAARENVVRSLSEINFGGKEVAVRINGVASQYFLADMLALEGLPIHSVVVPKVNSASEIFTVEVLLQQLERKNPMGVQVTIQALIETAKGLAKVEEICTAGDRVASVIFGAGDYTADTGIALTRRGLFYARSRIVAAATEAGIQSIDYVYPDFRNLEALEEDTAHGKEMGFSGRWAIHPAQVAVINKVYTPAPEEVSKAKKIIAAYEEALSKGIGSISLDNQMVDEAVLKIMRRREAIAKKVGLWDQIDI